MASQSYSPEPHANVEGRSGVALQCQLEARNNHVSWKWTAASTHLPCEGAYISQVVTGREFAFFLTTSGELLQCGATPKQASYEQLRPGQRKRRRNHAHLVGLRFNRLSVGDRAAHTGYTFHSVCHPVALHLSGRPRVCQVVCGASHCVVLCEDRNKGGACGALFSWGHGAYGQLGLGEKQQASTMTRVTTSANLNTLLGTCDPREIVVRCGALSTYVLIRNTCTLWHWGLLPAPDPEAPFVSQGVPVEFPLLDESIFLVDVAVGTEHLVLLSTDGRVFTWGHGGSGQLGLGLATSSNAEQQSPSQVDFFRPGTKLEITAVACGWNHTVAVSKDGQVFAWGSNAFGACGATSRFCEYFQPVLVVIPPQLSCGLSSGDLRVEIRCTGDTTILFFVRGTGDEPSVVERVFMWGISSLTTATLLPTEVPGFKGKGRTLSHCCVGLGALVCMLQTSDFDSMRDEVRGEVWAVQDVAVRSDVHQTNQDKSSQKFTGGLVCYHLTTKDQICVQVQAVRMGAAAKGLKTAAEGDLVGTDALQLAQQICRVKGGSSQSTDSGKDEKDHNLLQILSVRRRRYSSSSAEVVPHLATIDQLEVILLAQGPGRGTISLVRSDIPVFGGTFMVDIGLLDEECDAKTTTGIGHSCGDERDLPSGVPCVLGACVGEIAAMNQRPTEMNWCRIVSNRLRVWTDDVIIVLMELPASQIDFSLCVKAIHSQFQCAPEPHTSSIHVLSGGNQPRGACVCVSRLFFTSPGSYTVYMTNSSSRYGIEKLSPLFSVDCCANGRQRGRMLSKHCELIRAKYEKAQQASALASPAAQFSLFMSSILQSAALRDVVAFSPWLASSGEEHNALPYDFDRERSTHMMVMQAPRDPFVLWTPLISSFPHQPSDGITDDTAEGLNLSFHSILPTWAANAGAMLSFRLATWLEKLIAASSETLRPEGTAAASSSTSQDFTDLTEARERAAVIGFAVRQNPSDFLGDISSAQERAVHQILSIDPVVEVDVHDSIAAWRRTNGDLFYTIESKEKQVRRYGHESHDFPDTAQSCGITRLKGLLSDFLWKFAESIKVEELFLSLTAPLDESLLGGTNDIGSSVIRLHQLAAHTEAMGFKEATTITKQEWFALFRGIQALSLPSATGIPFSVFCTFLVDPFHQFFWRQNIHQVNAAAVSIDAVTHALLENFTSLRFDERFDGNSDDFGQCSEASDSAELLIPWPEFVSSLRGFHVTLELSPMAPSDCCRLLYRFDTHGNAQISTSLFQQSLLASLRDLEVANKNKKNRNQVCEPLKPKAVIKKAGKMKVAIDNDHRRPNVEVFTSSNAVHKLFAARAKLITTAPEPSFSSIEVASKGRRPAAGSAGDAVAVLRASGNSRLARVRSLPVSHLLREGVHFRPTRQSTYQVEHGEYGTQAQVLGAEDSY